MIEVPLIMEISLMKQMVLVEEADLIQKLL